MKILVIDDSEVIRNLLTDFLEDMGHTVDLAINGLTGIETALADDYDIVICDIHMPKRNGYQVYTSVSKQKPDTRFILTDSLPGDLADKAQEEGVKYLLTKPFDLDQLRSMIKEISQMVKSS
jgi:DNA-binding response OmpR family regulator